MKTIVSMLFIVLTITLTACGNNNNSTESTSKKTDSSSHSANANTEPKNNESAHAVVTGYLNLKNALTVDNGKEAASAANEISTALTNLDQSSLMPDQKKIYSDVKDDIKEHAEHIAANGSNIAHQREHFALLSQDIIDLVKIAGSSKTLYRDFCPMYNNNKGASWLSETKEIKNPYLGKKMPECGEVKDVIKAKG